MIRPVTILMIRHATTPKVGKGLTGWLPGISLDENGRNQAERLAVRLRKAPIASIYSSPLERTVETALPLARDKGLEIIRKAEFGEVHFGTWQGKDFPEIEQDSRWPLFNEYRSGTRAPEGELMLETQARMVRGLLELAPKHENETVAVFSHADAIKSAVAHFLGIPLDFHNRLEILPVSITTVELFRNQPLVRSVNVMNITEY
jgi:probable phosphoglycerate mutase